jgi:hypothetical protein
MKNKTLIIGIFLLLVISGLYVYLNHKPENQTCEIKGNYCYFNNTLNLKYFNHNETIPENLLFNQSMLDNYLIRKDNQKLTLDEAFGIDVSKYICKSTGKEPEYLELFYVLCEDNIEGCGYSRNAILCGNVYFIEEYTDWTGPRLFGPFNL